MSETTAMIIGVAVGLSLVVVVGLGYRWRKRRPMGRRIALCPSDHRDWTDEDIDRILSALESPDSDENDEAFV